MDDLTEVDRQSLIYAIASREGTAKQLAQQYETTVDELRSFVNTHEEEIALAREALENSEESDGDLTPTQLGDLWITKKHERLARYQTIADKLYDDAQHTVDATVLRELRFYMVAAANELGQLLHRGSGESGSDSLSVDIQGITLDNLR